MASVSPSRCLSTESAKIFALVAGQQEWFAAIRQNHAVGRDLFDKRALAQLRFFALLRHIDKDKGTLVKQLKELGKPIENLDQELFIIQIESNIYTGIKNKKQLLDALKKHIK